MYRERLLPSVLSYLAWAVIFPSVTLVLSAVFAPAALPLGLLSLVIAWTLMTAGAPTIRLASGELEVAGAKIRLSQLKDATAIEPENVFHERGPGLDARAYRVFAPGIKGLVRVQVADPNDPTPYWVFSSRNAKRVAELINAR